MKQYYLQPSDQINSLYKGKGGVIYRSGEFHTMPTGYAVMGPDTIKSIDGILYVGLSSLDGGKPIVWKDGVVDTLNINGYISAIYSEPEY